MAAMRSVLLVASTLLVSLSVARGQDGAPPPELAEIAKLAKSAGGAESSLALSRLVDLALLSSDTTVARAATEAIGSASFGPDGVAALERVARHALTTVARARALELATAGRVAQERTLLTEIALGDDPTSLRSLAVDLLSGDAAALPDLVPLLQSPDPRLQARVLRLLGRARNAAAIAHARTLLAPDARTATPLAVAAIEVLRDEGGPESIRTLVRTAAHELGDAREFATKSLAVMDRGVVLLTVLPLLAPGAPPAEALVAVDVVARAERSGATELAEPLRAAVDHPDPEVATAAVRALGAVGDRGAVPKLERALTSLDPEVAAAAVESLTQLRKGDPTWRERLLRLAHAPKLPIRLAAVRALGSFCDESLVPQMVAWLDDKDWSVREAAIVALGDLRSKAAVEPLIARLDVERRRLREEIALALRRTCGQPFRDVVRDWRRWWTDHKENFVVPPLDVVEAMEARLERNLAPNSTRASFYGVPVESDHLALVIDVSGSMGELDVSSQRSPATGAGAGDAVEPNLTKLDVAKAEVAKLLDQLPDGAELNLFFFNDDVQRWSRSLVAVDRARAAKATAFVRERRPGGATNLFEALADALDDPQIDTIYLLTDGDPTVGKIVEPGQLRREVRRRNASRHVRIDAISIGHVSPLLQRLAEDSAGTFVQR
jgi:HEAT repeat protein